MDNEAQAGPLVVNGVNAAAAAIGISREEVRLAMLAGRLRSRRLGRRHLFTRADLQAFVDALPMSDSRAA
ncbi:helix-turn-helix domain-containing protein [Blastochloris tepida]|uniref:Helix-turn-helix domain-containing protein n=1 Tax=Blastochloris tepida TaxID=2233851 RepID=A0A348G1I8_9HYPH|nr:helix-turn-helix domain-containing protein [Blastochloris tepida]BBF93421.1 hypothetical protein BLTE_21060 [Blastochloris tepida]